MGGAECTSPGVTRRPLPWQWKVTRQRSPPCCPLQRVMWTAACLVLHNLQLQLPYELTTTSPLTANQPDENMKNRRITGGAHKRVCKSKRKGVFVAGMANERRSHTEGETEREREYLGERDRTEWLLLPPLFHLLLHAALAPLLW